MKDNALSPKMLRQRTYRKSFEQIDTLALPKGEKSSSEDIVHVKERFPIFNEQVPDQY